MSESIVQALLEIQQAWCRDHDPGESIPVPDHPLGGKPSPDTQPELPLWQLQAVLKISVCCLVFLKVFPCIKPSTCLLKEIGHEM